MSNASANKYKIPVFTVGILFVIWGIMGLIDLSNVPYSGYQDDGNYTVIRVYPGSPAERANLMKGDYIRSIGGISVEDSSALARRSRAKIGQTRAFVVERRDKVGEAPARKSIDITYANLPAGDTALSYAGVIVGLCFVGCGLTASLKAPARSANLLALVGICIGLAFFNGPYISSYSARMLAASIQNAVVFLGFAFLLHYMLETPKQKQFLQRKHARKVIYGPAVLVVLFIAFLIVFQPRATSGLNRLTNILVLLSIAGYFGCAVVAMIHTYAKAAPQERGIYGLNIALAGSVIGFLPLIIAALVSVVAPKLVLPGSDYYFLTLILIPVSLVTAMLRQSRPL
jgi:hypothetical protein